MNLQLDGQHVLITGGSKGIGLACAMLFVEEGARVTLVSRDAANLASGRASILAQHPDAASRVATLSADLRDAQAAAAMVAQCEDAHGPVDVLVNSAGAARRTPPEELTPTHWHDAMLAKYFTYVHVMDPVVKRMAGRGAGAIVNVVGMGGKVASPTHLPGGSANAALLLASAGLAAAYAARGVRVNAVNPGITVTERMNEGLAADARAQGITPGEALERINRRLPLGRPATPAEVANMVVFLASPRASYVSGAVVSMDGAATPMVV